MRIAGLTFLICAGLPAQVTYDRIVNSAKEPGAWLTYSGSYAAHRYSGLAEVTPANVANLRLKWMNQVNAGDRFETSPIVADGVMYVTESPSNVPRARSEDWPPPVAL
jgi:glucose dehydrogenase